MNNMLEHSRLRAVGDLGQQIWLDNLSRNLLASGQLADLIAADGIQGLTSNPAIFYHAIQHDPAYQAALPQLRRAARVTLAVSPAPHSHGRQAELPGVEMARYLARHDVRVTVSELDGGQPAGAALLELASEVGADLLAMGGYGHWRLREWMLGGGTRSVLRGMTLPVLMAH